MATKAEILAMIHAPETAEWVDGITGPGPGVITFSTGVSGWTPCDANGAGMISAQTKGRLYWDAADGWQIKDSGERYQNVVFEKAATEVDMDALAAARAASPSGDIPETSPHGDTHPLDTAPHGTTAVATDAGIVTIGGGSTSSPDASDALHGAVPVGTKLISTPQGIEVEVPVPVAHRSRLGATLWAVERDVAAVVAWIKKEWREKVEHQSAA
jgi:hypothetical protein